MSLNKETENIKLSTLDWSSMSENDTVYFVTIIPLVKIMELAHLEDVHLGLLFSSK